MSAAVFTLYEGHYHLGVGALLNSLVRCGYSGRFLVGHRGDPPPWAKVLDRTSESECCIGSIEVAFIPVNPAMHLGYFKPFAALQLFETYSDIETLIYADPDLVFLADWEFFDVWMYRGLALVMDSNFSSIPPGHPWRVAWENLLLLSSTEIANFDQVAHYVNGGFFGITRQQSELLKIWCNLTSHADSRFCDVSKYEMSKRSRAVVSDQDLLNASLLAWKGECVILGPEAMGFTGYHFIMSHAIGAPKPWDQLFTLESLKGNKVSQASQLWLNNCFSPIPLFDVATGSLKRFDMAISKLISRIWTR